MLLRKYYFGCSPWPHFNIRIGDSGSVHISCLRQLSTGALGGILDAVTTFLLIPLKHSFKAVVLLQTFFYCSHSLSFCYATVWEINHHWKTGFQIPTRLAGIVLKPESSLIYILFALHRSSSGSWSSSVSSTGTNTLSVCGDQFLFPHCPRWLVGVLRLFLMHNDRFPPEHVCVNNSWALIRLKLNR